MKTQIGDTYQALHLHVGELMSRTPEADSQYYAILFICGEIDKLKQRLEHIVPQRDVMD